MATLKYPSGRTITYTPSAARRMLSAVDQNTTPLNTSDDTNYVTSAAYAPNGAVISFINGFSAAFAGITTTNAYNKRLQPVTLSAAAPSATLMSLSYDFHLGTGDNGNVFQIVNNKDNNRTQNFQYDALQRITQASTRGPNWGETFTIDAWGNLTNKGPVTGKTNSEMLNAAPATVNNRLTGFGYDAAGNMTSNGTATYTYDAENRLVATAGWTYVYDGDGRRVKKSNSASNGTLYWTGVGGDSLLESSLNGSGTEEYVFFNGRRIARRDASTGAVHYYFSDHLGSASVIASATAAIQEESDYYPYGGEIAITNNDPNIYKFTGKERDSETGIDNFTARYFGSSMGRAMSPDDGTDHNSANPQSLNRYSYVHNNPLRFTDPFGHSTQTANNGDVLAVYDDGDNGVYQHTDIDDRSDWDGSKLDSDDEGTNYMGETPRWDEFAAHDRAHPNGISNSAMRGAQIHFGQSLDRDIAELNAIANSQSLGVTALFARHGQSFDIKTGPFADSGPGTGYLLNGTYQTIESAGNYLAGLNSQTGIFLGKHISPEMAQKLFGAYQQGGLPAVMKTYVTGKEYPGTSGPYWGEIPYSGYAQQEGIDAGTRK